MNVMSDSTFVLSPNVLIGDLVKPVTIDSIVRSVNGASDVHGRTSVLKDRMSEKDHAPLLPIKALGNDA